MDTINSKQEYKLLKGHWRRNKLPRVRLDGLRQQVISLERVTVHRHRVTL